MALEDTPEILEKLIQDDYNKFILPAKEVSRVTKQNIIFFHTYAVMNVDKYFLSMADIKMYQKILHNYGIIYNILAKKSDGKWCYLTMLNSIKRLEKKGIVTIYDNCGRLAVFLKKEFIDEVLEWTKNITFS